MYINSSAIAANVSKSKGTAAAAAAAAAASLPKTVCSVLLVWSAARSAAAPVLLSRDRSLRGLNGLSVAVGVGPWGRGAVGPWGRGAVLVSLRPT